MVNIMEEFDYISEYKVLYEGYCDPWVSPYASEDDEPEYFVERGYEVKHNGHVFKVHDWIFINMKLWQVEEYDPDPQYNTKWNYKGDFESLDLALARVKELAAE